jgi:hypothetical protein
MTSDPAIEPWQPLPDGAGTVLAVAGDVRVAAQSGRLRAWRGLRPLWQVEVGEPNPARPTVLADRVLWGPFAVDLDTGAVTDVPFARPAAGFAQTAHAWSSDGTVAVAAGRRRDRAGSPRPAAAWLLGDAGPITLWSGVDVPPVAVFADPRLVVVGHRHPEVHNTEGVLLRSLDGVTSAQRIDGHAGRLLVVEAGALSVWDPAAGTLLGRLRGGWVDACLTPDGALVLAADMAGNLCRLTVASGLLDNVEIPADGPVVGVATDGEVLLASFARLPALRVREFAGFGHA